MATETPMAIAPLTPVFFGDGRPSDAGESSFNAGMFPPSPRTTQGVVRTALLRSVEGLNLGPGADGARIRGLVGPPKHLPDGWQISGPWPARWHQDEATEPVVIEPWLPCPGWLATSRDGRLTPLQLQPQGIRSDSEAPMALVGAGRFPRRWLNPAQIKQILNGAMPTDTAPEGLPPFVSRELRTGLQLVPGKRTAEEGMLYTREFHRLAEHSGLALRLRTPGPLQEMRLEALSSGVTSLGGKNRVAQLCAVRGWSADFAEALKPTHLPKTPTDGARFLLWATTPVHARDPLKPGLSALREGGAQLKLLSASVGPPQWMGGFSLAQGHGTAAQRTLPPGSAWLVAVEGGTASERGTLIRSLHDAHRLGDSPAERGFGFGHTLVALPPASWSTQAP